jgi:phosphatidylglycerophosphatase A
LVIIILRVCGVKVNSLAVFGLSFVFFRIFDITKPLIIGYFDRTLKGATGIMVDDLLAAIFAAISVSILLIAFHTFQ